MVRTDIIYITLSYKHTPRIGVAYTSYFAGSLNISIGKTLVSSSGVPFAYLFIGGKPYYSSSLSLNKSINPTSIGL